MKTITLSKPVLLAAGWAASGNSATFSDFSHKPCLMGVLNCGCEQKGNQRAEHAPPADLLPKRGLLACSMTQNVSKILGFSTFWIFALAGQDSLKTNNFNKENNTFPRRRFAWGFLIFPTSLA